MWWIRLALLQTEDVELAERFAEAAVRDPVRASAALDLMRRDGRVRVLAAPTLLALQDRPARLSIDRKEAEDGSSHALLVEVKPLGDRALDLRLVVDEQSAPGELHADWSSLVEVVPGMATFVPGPELLLVVEPAVFADPEELRSVLAVDEALRREALEAYDRTTQRRVRRAVDALLSR